MIAWQLLGKRAITVANQVTSAGNAQAESLLPMETALVKRSTSLAKVVLHQLFRQLPRYESSSR